MAAEPYECTMVMSEVAFKATFSRGLVNLKWDPENMTKEAALRGRDEFIAREIEPAIEALRSLGETGTPYPSIALDPPIDELSD